MPVWLWRSRRQLTNGRTARQRSSPLLQKDSRQHIANQVSHIFLFLFLLQTLRGMNASSKPDMCVCVWGVCARHGFMFFGRRLSFFSGYSNFPASGSRNSRFPGDTWAGHPAYLRFDSHFLITWFRSSFEPNLWPLLRFFSFATDF